MNVNDLGSKTLEIKNLVLDVFEAGKCGHIASSFSCAEIMTCLFYGGVLRYRPDEPKWEDRDRFILSKGHAAILYYCILGDLGFFPKEELFHFAQKDSILGVHAHATVPGVEVTTGSLASGFGVGAGMALAAKQDLKNHLVVTLLGDGECYEGAVWESAMFAAHNRLNNLVVVIDHNHMCCSGFIEDNLGSEPLDGKWRAFGFDVLTVDGHDTSQLMEAFRGLRSRKSKKPLCIIADTVKAHGLSSVENTPLCHSYAPVRPEAMELARKELNGGAVR